MRTCLLLILFFYGIAAHAADSLQVSINKTVFAKGDSIEFTCTIPDYSAVKLATATLNVWIEDIDRNKRWKYRYPIINGEVSASLAISDKIPDGQYAINFLVQRGFFRMMGQVQDHDKKDSLVNYMMIVKNKGGTYFDNARVAADGSFRLKSTLFVDSAYFVFSPVKKVKNNHLMVRIETPLDSFFTPVLSETRFITVGKSVTGNAETMRMYVDTNKYVFTTDEVADKTLLPGVTVIGKIKKRIDQFNEENSRGVFQRDDAMVFDGLDNPEIARSVSLYQFLQSKVPGIVIDKDSTGLEYARWRNEIVEVYVDEFKMDIGDHLFVVPGNIAMIKVYRPPAQLSAFSGGAGAIAVYTKRGRYADARDSHNFIVKGYTSMDSTWE